MGLMSALQPKEFVSSRAKTILALIGSAAFVAVAAFLPDTPGNAGSWRASGIAFFGLCSLVLIWLLVRPQRLSLDPVGFTLSGGFVRTPKVIRWSETDPFFVYSLPRGGRMIGFNFKDGSRERTHLMEINRRFGADGALPKLWPGNPEHFAQELNAFRERALRR